MTHGEPRRGTETVGTGRPTAELGQHHALAPGWDHAAQAPSGHGHSAATITVITRKAGHSPLILCFTNSSVQARVDGSAWLSVGRCLYPGFPIGGFPIRVISAASPKTQQPPRCPMPPATAAGYSPHLSLWRGSVTRRMENVSRKA